MERFEFKPLDGVSVLDPAYIEFKGGKYGRYQPIMRFTIFPEEREEFKTISLELIIEFNVEGTTKEGIESYAKNMEKYVKKFDLFIKKTWDQIEIF